MPDRSVVGAPSRVTKVGRDTGVGITILSCVKRRVRRNVGATRVSGVICSVAADVNNVPTPLGCRNCPCDMYASMGRRIYRKFPSGSIVLGSNSVVGMSYSAVLGKCFSSSSEVCYVKGMDPRGGGLIRIAGRYIRLKLGRMGP